MSHQSGIFLDEIVVVLLLPQYHFGENVETDWVGIILVTVIADHVDTLFVAHFQPFRELWH